MVLEGKNIEGKNIDLALINENEGGNGGASPGLVDSGITIPNTISNPNSEVIIVTLTCCYTYYNQS